MRQKNLQTKNLNTHLIFKGGKFDFFIDQKFVSSLNICRNPTPSTPV